MVLKLILLFFSQNTIDNREIAFGFDLLFELLITVVNNLPFLLGV
jgi:hypothetical protein